MNIKELIEKEESETLEFKKSTAQLERALKSICGFSNHKRGKFILELRKMGKPLDKPSRTKP